MLSSPIENLISAAGADLLTDIFLIATGILLIGSLICKYRNKAQAFTQYAPTLLTSLGILGTFMGIVAGLLQFDTTHIDQSISPLLEGLKTAFTTSLGGMIASIIYKLVASSGCLDKNSGADADSAEEVTGAALYSVLSEQSDCLKQLTTYLCDGDNANLRDLEAILKQQYEGISAVQKAIGGDGEYSLLGQFKQMRLDMIDDQKRSDAHMQDSLKQLTAIAQTMTEQHSRFQSFEQQLYIKLQEFADMMSKSATEQVIEALKGVIQDFNNNLTEQFGENFKQLNAAVLELVTWQENYKQQLVEMKAQYDHGVQAITQTETSVAHIGEKAQTIPAAMDSLVTVMNVNQHQIEELSRHLNAFEKVRDKAVEAVPEIREQIDMAIAGARQANDEMAKGVQDSTEKMKEVVLESVESYSNAVDRSSNALNDAATTTSKSTIEIKDQFTTAISDINNTMRNLVDELQTGGKELNKSYITAGEKLVENIEGSSKTVNESYIKAGEKMASAISTSGEEMNAAYKKLSTSYISDTENMSREFRKGIEEIQSVLANSIQEQAQSHRQQADRIFAGLDSAIRDALSNTGESVAKQVNMIDQTMGQEVEKVMQAMGSALASISGQFTRDYTKLVKQMQAITSGMA